MHLPLKLVGGDRITLNLAHLLWIEEVGTTSRFRLVPDILGRGEDTLLVAETFGAFEALPGLCPARAVRPHEEPRRILVNLALVVTGTPCAEGTLLRLATRAEPRKLLVDTGFDTWSAAIASGSCG